MSTGRIARLQQLVEGGELAAPEELKLLHSLAKEDPASLALVANGIAQQRRALRKEATQARAQLAQLEATLERMSAPPWFPATVLRPAAQGRADIVSGGRRQIVATAPGIDAAELEPGCEVWLTGEGLLVARGEDAAPSGLVGSVCEVGPGWVVVRGAGDDELRATCTPELARELRAGDRVLYARDLAWVFERLDVRAQSRFELEAPPALRFEDIGGLDAVVRALRDELDLHLQHPELAARFGLVPMRGFLLVGPPGVGKTLIAGAVACHVAGHASGARFLHVKPGALRGMYYGEAEGRIRELFEAARRTPGLAVLFLDELDSYGARGVGIGQDIDGRVLGALLAELNGLGSARNVLCIGATNRLDLCDPALVRQGRFGDRIVHVPRPGREATRQILSVHLRGDLPFAEGEGEDGAQRLAEAAASYLHAPAGGYGVLVTVTLRDSQRREIAPAGALSGALLASAVQRARHAAARRALHDAAGLALEDLLAALDQALEAEARKLLAPQVARRSLDIEEAEEIVLVELPPGRRPRHHRYLRAA